MKKSIHMSEVSGPNSSYKCCRGGTNSPGPHAETRHPRELGAQNSASGQGLGAEHGVMLCFPLREAGSRRLHTRLFRVSKTKNHMYLAEERVFTLQYL